MSATADTSDHQRLLGELVELGMGLARRLGAAAEATDDPLVLAQVGTAFHHVTRGVRQSMALRARFAAGWVPAEPRVQPAAAVAPAPERPAELRPERVGWDEYERPDFDERPDALDRACDLSQDEPVSAQAFEAAVEAGVARLRRGVRALRPRPAPGPARRSGSGRAGLMNGAAALRLVDSS